MNDRQGKSRHTQRVERYTAERYVNDSDIVSFSVTWTVPRGRSRRAKTDTTKTLDSLNKAIEKYEARKKYAITAELWQHSSEDKILRRFYNIDLYKATHRNPSVEFIYLQDNPPYEIVEKP